MAIQVSQVIAEQAPSASRTKTAANIIKSIVYYAVVAAALASFVALVASQMGGGRPSEFGGTEGSEAAPIQRTWGR